MRTIRTALAAMLVSLAFVASGSDAEAQARRGGNGSSSGTTRTTSRSTSVTGTKPSSSKSSGTVTRQSGSVTRQSGTVPRQSGSVNRPAANPSDDRKPSTTVTRPATSRPSGQARPSTGSSAPSRPSATRPSVQTRPSGSTGTATKPGNGNKDYKSPDRDKPISVTRPGTRTDRKPAVPKVHPRERDFIVYDRPAHFWTGNNHWYGHRVKILPSHVRRHIYHGITYYCYNDIWYRPFGGYYVVCRPPFGTVLAANLIADMTWAAVRLSYYYTVANTYSKISENNAYIAQQNAVIAQNNATIAAQNQTIAMNQQLASQAYDLANELGLVQSYAAAGSSYYYQDGVFYTMDSDGEYRVILPPAGALVETLPEDYEMITLGGNEYYKVDDTVYRVTISEGKPFFEVLGQL